MQTKNKVMIKRLKIAVAKDGGDPMGGYVKMAISVGSQINIKKQSAKSFLLNKYPEVLKDMPPFSHINAIRLQRRNTEIVEELKRSRPKRQITPQNIPQKTNHVFVNSDAFLASYEWRVLRMKVLRKYGARCQCCGATPADGVKMHVDHIKPRRIFPLLALEESNLQVLCEPCNHGKSNWDMTDWRNKEVANGL